MFEKPIVNKETGKIEGVERETQLHVRVRYAQDYLWVTCDLCHCVIWQGDTLRPAPEEIIKAAFFRHAH